ncbi:hypothetical protein [Polluticaenibacter yanchengensis]|uniref:Lipoprotein n=1 Tax=Polluticaenibacter yanchengensis TaxID=3014562 RepID=A0ABT4UPQ0_9BACT|nr:hypothetical protein [Chitinophagaceae bacterium LY-5]
MKSKMINLKLCSFILILLCIAACNNHKKSNPCFVTKTISRPWTLKDYDKSDSRFKSLNEFKTYKIARDLNLYNIRDRKSNYFRIWYQSPDPLYNWVVDVDFIGLEYKVFTYCINFKEGDDSIYYKLYRYEEERLKESTLKDIEYNIKVYDIVNLSIEPGYIITGYGNIFEIETMWNGNYHYELFTKPDIIDYKASKPLLAFVDFLIKKFDLPPLGENPCEKDRSNPERWITE